VATLSGNRKVKEQKRLKKSHKKLAPIKEEIKMKKSTMSLMLLNTEKPHSLRASMFFNIIIASIRYSSYIKGYMKKLKTKLEEKKPEKVAPFMKGA
jgi:hypothetical protein